jgi:TatA/E family protein of Tat protein translocase
MQTFLAIHFSSLLAIGLPQGFEWLILLAVALLIFGRRLPDVARSFGKSINEFKKGMSDVTNEINKEPMDQASSQNVGGAAKLPNANAGNTMGQDASQARESDASNKV